MTNALRVAQQSMQPSEASATLNRMRRATDDLWLRSSWTSPPAGNRSILALLNSSSLSNGRSEAESLPDAAWPHTGRNALLAALSPLIERGEPVSLLLIHVDQPFAVREACGLSVAEAFHRGIEQALRNVIRRSDLLLRLADRDFALVLDRCGVGDCAHVARRIERGLCDASILTEAGEIRVALTIGAATTSGAFADPAVLLDEAEHALDRVSLGLTQNTPAAVRAIAREIVTAHGESRLVLAIQPIVAATTRTLFCFEALTRIRGSDGTLMLPAAVMPVAERTGLITLIDSRALELAVARLVARPLEQLSVNVSMRSALDPRWIGLVVDHLGHDRSLATRLIVEITETATVEDITATGAVLDRLKRLGVRIAMDDFGAGHSSFRNLRHLGVDLLKIDGSFVRDLAGSADDGMFVRTLIDLARHLGIETVAEWVEDEATAATLTEWGVDYLQGHLIGRAELSTSSPA